MSLTQLQPRSTEDQYSDFQSDVSGPQGVLRRVPGVPSKTENQCFHFIASLRHIMTQRVASLVVG